MNKHLALIPIAGIALLTAVGCGTGANSHSLTPPPTNTSSANIASNMSSNANTSGANTASNTSSNANTSGGNTVSTSAASTSNGKTVSASSVSTSNAKTVSTSTGDTSVHTTSTSSEYADEIALIKRKGYDVTGTTPNASVQTSSGATLTAWIGVAAHSDGHNQYVFFFLNGKYLGTDTAKPSVGITSAKAAGTGSVAVTYPVYKKNDSFAKPTGTPATVTYTWDGSKLVPNHSMPIQFS